MSNNKIAALKLITGEELICTLLNLSENGDNTDSLILLQELADEELIKTLSFKNPLIIKPHERRKIKSYNLEPWLIINNDSIHTIDIRKIITVNRINDIELINEYLSFFKTKLTLNPKPINKIGYVGNVDNYKNYLERLYKDTDPYEKPKDI